MLLIFFLLALDLVIGLYFLICGPIQSTSGLVFFHSSFFLKKLILSICIFWIFLKTKIWNYIFGYDNKIQIKYLFNLYIESYF